MNEHELNKKLAEWVGFHKIEPNISVDWWRPDGHHEGSKLPSFTQSLDACFKWLEPELYRRGYAYLLYRVKGSKHGAIIGKQDEDGITNPYVKEIAETPVLALCLTVEKLIDEEAK